MEENLDVHVYGAVTVEWSQAARNVFSDPASLVIWGLASLYVHLGCRAALLKHTLLINNKGGEMGDEDCKNCIHIEFTEYAGVVYTCRRCAPVRLAGPPSRGGKRTCCRILQPTLELTLLRSVPLTQPQRCLY